MKGLDDHSFTIPVGSFSPFPTYTHLQVWMLERKGKKRQKGLKNEAAQYDDM